ncbi:MAG: DUF983 domain-containing protein [Saprospiraceae bacterium]|nr:DUF983 domain-containing protein [Saprospiraceae bacterium]MBK7220085.1 DUF983 domain-containing protein [Saprospiraceae bacterium]MBK7787284.1 DUF983 domain-containing protein [Saprospiraceae bacterium]MBK8109910.1 DUF983 domain-containing protein [Saprospiraceae bacterium]MBK8849415.1 DUF983 domain-containing protein [Saprospiraceae bacterium]
MNIVSSIFQYKCPRCREGKLYQEPFQFSKPLDMVDHCEVCGQKTEPEPGFYYGAMFLSYIVTGFLYLFIIGFCLIVLKWTVNQSFLLLLAFVALTYFKTARLSRSLWIHLVVKFEKDAKNNPLHK